MNTKLTLNIDETAIYNGKVYASNTKKSLSFMVEQFLKSVSYNNPSISQSDIDFLKLSPITKELFGYAHSILGTVNENSIL